MTTFRARVISATPAVPNYILAWRVGGEGLGGTSFQGTLIASPGQPAGTFSAPVTTDSVFGTSPTFGTFVVEIPGKSVTYPSTCVVEFEFTYADGTVSTFQQTSPLGATVGIAFANGRFEGLSTYVQARHDALVASVPTSTPPTRLSVAGHLLGFGSGLKGAAGYGIRHNDPGICALEADVLRRLGVNGVAQDQTGFNASGIANQFQSIFLGPPGAGAPTDIISTQLGLGIGPVICPFDPRAVPSMNAYITQNDLPTLKAAGTKEVWSQIGDELHLLGQKHIETCRYCATEFPKYVAVNNGPTTAQIYPLTFDSNGNVMGRPLAQADRLNFYWTIRYAQHVTAAYFKIAHDLLTSLGYPLFTMQQPNPTWGPESLDWAEFFRSGSTDCTVFETSNLDARMWPWDGYCADIMHGFGLKPLTLVKPDRGGFEQRSLAQVARGITRFHWYTYGPDYAKGDSYSSSPTTLAAVAGMANFLGATEHLFDSVTPIPTDVALLYPRSSETWDWANNDPIHIEDTRWIWSALKHAQIPVDIINEDSDFSKYKVIYVTGQQMRTDAVGRLLTWCGNGGTLWLGPGAMTTDESDSPLQSVTQPSLERWCPVVASTAGGPVPFADPQAITRPMVNVLGGHGVESGLFLPVVGRYATTADLEDEVLASFIDGHPAMTWSHFGKGRIYELAFYAGLQYSNGVRASSYDTRVNLDPMIRSMISCAALSRNVSQPVISSDPCVEAVALRRGQGFTVALMNWNFAPKPVTGRWLSTPVQDLTVMLPGMPSTCVSMQFGPLTITRVGNSSTVTLPRIDSVDVLDVG